MRSPWKVFTLAVLGALALPAVGHAFGFSGGGGSLGYANPEDHDGALNIGGHLEFDERGTRVHLLPNLKFWKADEVSDLSTNFDLYYHFARPGEVTPYLGGGLGLNRIDDDRTDHTETDLGANVFGGFRFPGEASHFFIEGRYTASDLPQVALIAGVTFHAR